MSTDDLPSTPRFDGPKADIDFLHNLERHGVRSDGLGVALVPAANRAFRLRGAAEVMRERRDASAMAHMYNGELVALARTSARRAWGASTRGAGC